MVSFLSFISALLILSQTNAFSVDGSSRRNFLKQVGVGSASAIVGQQCAPLAWAGEEVIGVKVGGKPVAGDESVMSPKAHGTSDVPVQSSLRYEVSNKLADRISNYNRRFAELGGYFEGTPFESTVREAVASTGGKPVTFYDSNSGKPLFVAPINRSVDDFIAESKVHGWPSFRDQEVVWENVRVLRNSGETVSVDGTHLGHDLPDKKGNRYCINLVSIAGNPV